MVPIFGQGFLTEALSPDHPDYGCLLLDPVNRKKNTTSVIHKKRNTMRQNKPCFKKITTKKQIMKKKSQLEELKRQKKISESMSVNRLLNEESELSELSSEEEFDDDEDMMTDDNGSNSSLSSTASSPTFRVIQTYPTVENWSNRVPLLPPMYNNYYLPSRENHCDNNISQDIIDTISATILLQRLSQDDGARPFKPLESSVIPNKVIVGHQEFTICWD